MNETLPTAIDRLYEVFGRVPRPTAIEYCPHCFLADEEQALLAPVPLRELPIEALQPYAANVMMTVGGTADFRYFLPRIFEVACTEGFDWPDLESVFSRLRFAAWPEWDQAEQAAVRGLFAAFWAQPGAGFDAADVLCAIGNAEDDLTPYLDGRDPLISGDLVARSLTNPFWVDREAQAEQVLAWLPPGPDS
jgi:hypothetical protein